MRCAHNRYEAHSHGYGGRYQCAGGYPCPQCDGKGYKLVPR
jgi:hypothetical protein